MTRESVSSAPSTSHCLLQETSSAVDKDDDIKSYSHFFSKNISIYAIFNDQRFNDMLTNDIVSFEQLDPGYAVNMISTKSICKCHKTRIGKCLKMRIDKCHKTKINENRCHKTITGKCHKTRIGKCHKTRIGKCHKTRIGKCHKT